MEREELVRQLNKGFAYLTEQEKLALTLFYFEELSEDEISYVLDIHLLDVDLCLTQARTKMRAYTTIFDDIDDMGRRSMAALKG